MKYDSRKDTEDHIRAVASFLYRIIEEILDRRNHHDESKLSEPEKSMYDEYKPLIKYAEVTHGYGSKEYEDMLKKMGEPLRHHFDRNSHHPEHFPDGISGMSLLDIIEMLADWKAASSQYGTPLNLEANRKRFKIDDQLFAIIENTVKELGW